MTIAIEVGSSNVYADLGYADALEMQRKASLAAQITHGIDSLGLTTVAAAELFGIAQAELSRITAGQFRTVSEATLLDLVQKVGQSPQAGRL